MSHRHYNTNYGDVFDEMDETKQVIKTTAQAQLFK